MFFAALKTVSAASKLHRLRKARQSRTGSLPNNDSSSSSSGGAASSTTRSSSVCSAASLPVTSTEVPTKLSLMTALEKAQEAAEMHKQRSKSFEQENARLVQALHHRDSHMLLREQYSADTPRLLADRDRQLAFKNIQIVNLSADKSKASEEHKRQVELLQSEAAQHKEAREKMALAKAAVENNNARLSLEVAVLCHQMGAFFQSKVGTAHLMHRWADEKEAEPEICMFALERECAQHKEEVEALRAEVASLRSQLQTAPQHSTADKTWQLQAARSANSTARRSDDCSPSDRLPSPYGRRHSGNNKGNNSGNRRQSSNAGSLNHASSSQHHHDSRRGSSSQDYW